MKVIIIDDESSLANALEMSITNKFPDLDVIKHTNPFEGLYAVFQNPDALILLDILMPFINGDKIIKFIEMNELPNKVIILSNTQVYSNDDLSGGCVIGCYSKAGISLDEIHALIEGKMM